MKGKYTEENLNTLVHNSLTANAEWVQLETKINLQREEC